MASQYLTGLFRPCRIRPSFESSELAKSYMRALKIIPGNADQEAANDPDPP